jgi:hypothetical protein
MITKHAHDGYSCWTPKLCTALNAVAELRTLAVRQDDHELSVRLDMIEATLKDEAHVLPGVRETVWCEAHDGLANPHFERDDCVYPHFTDQATRARMNAPRSTP